MYCDIVVLVQVQLVEIGIMVNLIMFDWVMWVNLGNQGVGDFVVQGIGLDNLDLDVVVMLVDLLQVFIYLCSCNFKVEGFSDLLVKGWVEMDQVQWVEIYWQVDQMVLEVISFCGICYCVIGFVMNVKVQDLKMLFNQVLFFFLVLFDQLKLV